MAVLSLSDAHLAYGHVALLDGAALSLEAGERLGLIGRNGAGKSSLLKIIAGLEKLDDGLLQLTQGLRIRYVPQEPVFEPEMSVFDAVSEGVAEAREVRERYEAHAQGSTSTRCRPASRRSTPGTGSSASRRRWRSCTSTARAGSASSRAARRSAWRWRRRWSRCPTCCCSTSRPTTSTSTRSPGSRSCCKGFRGSVVLITHDRAFLDAVATRIVELDRGVLRSYPGNFAAYEARKDEQLAAEALANARADKLLAQEEVWIRKGVEARRTRSVGRIERLEALRGAARGAARVARPGAPRGRLRHPERQDRRRAARRVAMRFGDKIDRQGLHRDDPARRQGRPDRPERRRQDDAAQADPRRAAADRGHRAPGHAARGRLLRPDAQRARPRRHARRHHQPGQRMDRDRGAAGST